MGILPDAFQAAISQNGEAQRATSRCRIDKEKSLPVEMCSVGVLRSNPFPRRILSRNRFQNIHYPSSSARVSRVGTDSIAIKKAAWVEADRCCEMRPMALLDPSASTGTNPPNHASNCTR